MQKENIDKYIKLAIERAEYAKNIGEVPVGAVLVNQDGEVISTGYNSPILSNDPSSHAEINALRNAGLKLNNYRFPKTTMIVTLEPCPMCVGAMIHARVNKIIFLAKEPRSGACGSIISLNNNPNLNHHIEIEFIENENYISMLKLFFKSRRVKA